MRAQTNCDMFRIELQGSLLAAIYKVSRFGVASLSRLSEQRRGQSDQDEHYQLEKFTRR